MLYTVSMNTDERILVIFLSVTLAVFLLLGIFVLILALQILSRIKRLTEKAEDIADKAEAVGDFFQKTAGPAALVKAVASIARNFTSKHKNKE